jgi:hypothetical protein
MPNLVMEIASIEDGAVKNPPKFLDQLRGRLPVMY